MTVLVYIGLGSNLGQPAEQIRSAVMELEGLPDSRVAAVSQLYRTAPVGVANQPDFVNAVAALETSLAPLDLLAALQAIESRHGRVREGERWGPRSLDLDLLLYGQQVIAAPQLTVPHPRLSDRAFVLYPLTEIAPADLVIPGYGTLAQLTAQCGEQGVWPLTDPDCSG